MVLAGPQGGTVRQEHFVLEAGRYNVIIRDARNVPASSSAHVGGPSYTWRLAATKLQRTPTSVAVGDVKTGTLPFIGAIALYQLTLSASTSVNFRVLAQGKASPSDMDSRLSIYDVTRGQYLGTNDDQTISNHNSLLGGTFDPGEYVAVVENVAPTATDLSFELHVELR